MNELKLELDRFMGSVRSNPPTEKLYDFLGDLSSEGKLFDYSEQDWVEAGRSYGMSDDEVSSWIETAASWLDDTTEGGEVEPEHSFWGSGGTKTMANPAPVTRGISSKSARRGTALFDDLMEELEADWDMDEEELGEIVEIRRAGDSFEIRLKGEDRWELIEGDEEEDTRSGDGPVGREERFGVGEEE